MTVLRTVARAGGAALLALFIAATGSLTASAQDSAAPDALPADAVVATVDGKPVTAGDVRIAFRFLPQQYYFLPAEFLFETVLNQMIDVKLMASAAEAEGLDTEDIERQVAFYRERMLRQAYLETKAAAAITPDTVKARYDAEVKDTPPEDEVRAHHILVATEEEAKAIAEQLAQGADFQTLAKEKSIDETSATNGGDLGYFKKGKMVAPFAEAAFATEPGKISAPVQTQFGWHLIQVDDRRPAATPTYEELAPEIRETLMTELVNQATQDVRADAKIDIVAKDPYAVLGLPRPPPAAEAPGDGGGEPPAEEPAAEAGASDAPADDAADAASE
jgi:peptidyl-prolyl cis-trans isomerase C